MLPAHERTPRAHWQVSFMVLALDFKAFTGRLLPPAPQSKFVRGGHVPPRERQGAATDRHTGGQGHGMRINLPGQDDAPLPLPHVNGGGHGHGTGGTPTAVWKHLERLRTYREARWAQKQKARAAKRQAKTKGTAKKPVAKQPGAIANLERKRCPAKGGVKSALEHYVTDFYAKPEKALAEQRDEVFAPAGGAVEGRGSGRPAAPIFTPPMNRNGARKKETRRRLTKSWVCERHGNPPYPTCALTHRGVRHSCSRGHHGHPKGVCMPCTPRHRPLPARLAS